MWLIDNISYLLERVYVDHLHHFHWDRIGQIYGVGTATSWWGSQQFHPSFVVWEFSSAFINGVFMCRAHQSQEEERG